MLAFPDIPQEYVLPYRLKACIVCLHLSQPQTVMAHQTSVAKRVKLEHAPRVKLEAPADSVAQPVQGSSQSVADSGDADDDRMITMKQTKIIDERSKFRSQLRDLRQEIQWCTRDAWVSWKANHPEMKHKTWSGLVGHIESALLHRFKSQADTGTRHRGDSAAQPVAEDRAEHEEFNAEERLPERQAAWTPQALTLTGCTDAPSSTN